MKCSDVTYDMRGDGCGEPAYKAKPGDLLWDPKAGEGHVIVAKIRCVKYNGRRVDCGCGGWGTTPCPSITLVCECGRDGSWRDHRHDILLARTRPPSPWELDDAAVAWKRVTRKQAIAIMNGEFDRLP